MRERSDARPLIAIATLAAVVDQVTKLAVVAALGPEQPESRINLVGRWFALEYAENRGAAFGLFSGLAPLLVVASLAVLAVVIYRHFQDTEPSLWQTTAIALVAGGALGNLIDRVRLGYVVDFIAVGPWPNFNVADSAIAIGVLMLVWSWTRSGVPVEDESRSRGEVVSRE